MAGEVRARVQVHANGDVHQLVPEPCPARGVQWEPPCCVIADTKVRHWNVCPFLLGVRLLRGGSAYDIDRGAMWDVWLNENDAALDQWRPICLRKEGAFTDVGARLRP